MRIVILIVAFLAMIGGGIGGLYFWGIDPVAKFNQLIGKAPPPVDDAPPPPPKVDPPSYIEFGVLVVPVVQEKDVKYLVDMIIRLEVPYDKKEVVAHNLPRLQNAFLQEMMSFLPGHMRETNQVDQSVAAKRLVPVAATALEPGLVKSVRIDQVMIRQ